MRIGAGVQGPSLLEIWIALSSQENLVFELRYTKGQRVPWSKGVIPLKMVEGLICNLVAVGV